MPEIKAVVVDVDDTLCLTEAASFELENEVLARMGRQPMDREIHLETWGKPLFEIIAVRSPGVGIEAFKAAYHPVIAEFIESKRLDIVPAENYRALDTLIEQGKTIMVLTSRTHSELKHMLEPDHLLAGRVKTFYYRDNMEFHKPDPRAFDVLLDHTGLQHQECVYVGDSLGDATAAMQAGLHFIASLESGLRQKEDFDSLGVDRFVYKFPDIVEAIHSLENGK